MSKPKMKATERKALLRTALRNNFEEAGCQLADLKAGPQKYTAVRQPGSEWNIAAIYGSRHGASLWIKEKVHDRLRDKYPAEYARFVDVVDVDLFRRGFVWAVHFKDPEAPTLSNWSARSAYNGEAARKQGALVLKNPRSKRKNSKYKESNLERTEWKASALNGVLEKALRINPLNKTQRLIRCSPTVKHGRNTGQPKHTNRRNLLLRYQG